MEKQNQLSIEERKKLLLKKLRTIETKKLSKTSFIFPFWNKKFGIIDINLSKEVHGILHGEFITTFCWGDDTLNLCVGMASNPDPKANGQQSLYFLVEGNSGLTCFANPQGVYLTSFKQLEEDAKAVFV